MSEDTSATPGTPHDVAGDISEQAKGREVRLRIDERDLNTAYANGFRTNATAEEVIVDFGMNLAGQASPDAKAPAEIVFKANHRVVLNYYSAKRLALTLGQVIRSHEERFGELKLNAGERSKS